MFNQEDLFPIGRINKAFGLKGFVKVSFEAFFLEFIQELKIVFLENKGEHVPYFIEAIEQRKNDTLIRFEDINTKEGAMTLNTKHVYVDITKFKGLEDSIKDENYYGDLVGLDAILVNDDKLNIGKIEEILYNERQDLAQVTYKGVEMLIPLHDDTLVEFDDKEAHFNLPEGYIEIYI